jgi:hypothetical protein
MLDPKITETSRRARKRTTFWTGPGAFTRIAATVAHTSDWEPTLLDEWGHRPPKHGEHETTERQVQEPRWHRNTEKPPVGGFYRGKCESHARKHDDT